MTYLYFEIPVQPGSEARVQNILDDAAERNLWTKVDRSPHLIDVVVKVNTDEEKMVFKLLHAYCDEY